MHRSPAFARLRRLRGVAGLVVLGLLCRAFIPAGFMPAAFGAGGPVAVCHGGLAGEFFRRLEASRVAQAEAAGHIGHATHGGLGEHAAQTGHGDPGAGHADPGARDGHAPAADHEAWEHCPFGAAFGAALLAGDVTPELPVLAQAFEVIEPTRPVSFRPVSSYRARAPPSSAIHS
jgi:hypothetical protein